MEYRSSDFNLRMLNLWIGLCRGEAGLPLDVRHLGYRDKWIELEFRNSQDEAVNPELIIASDQLGHTVMFEWKEGPNVERDQLRRYAAVVSDDLVQNAVLSPRETSCHDTCVVGLVQHADRLCMGVSEGGCDFPLLVVEDDGISLRLNKFTAEQLTRVFDGKLTLDLSKVPSLLVPFDHNSEFWVIAEHVMPQIVEYMCAGHPRFTLDQVARDCVPVWDPIVAPAYKRQLHVKMKQVVNDAAMNEFREYLRIDRRAAGRTGSPTWQITYNPKDLRFDRRSRQYRKLQTRQRDFIEALRTGKRRPIQLSLDI